MATAVSIILDGELEKFVHKQIKDGYAASKTEVLRNGLVKLKYDAEHEDISDDPELMYYLLGVKLGHIKPKIVGKNEDLGRLLAERRSSVLVPAKPASKKRDHPVVKHVSNSHRADVL